MSGPIGPSRRSPAIILLPVTMSEPSLQFVQCPDANGGHRMAYWQWGNPAATQVLVCVHGLTRQGRDFDVLAQSAIDQAGESLRVVCPDIVGRGQSDWLKDPQGYQVGTYAADMLHLLAQLQASTLDWLGTSMGGLIGMAVAGQPDLPPWARIRRLVLNDVGPTIEWQALQRIGQYLGRTGRFDHVQQAANALWLVSSSFGPHTPAQWLALTQHQLKPLDDGSSQLTLHYDPALALPFAAMTPESSAQAEAALWLLYEQIRARTLVVRGVESDLLSVATAQAMTQRGPRAELLSFAGVGHAPTFVATEQVAAVLAFLLG